MTQDEGKAMHVTFTESRTAYIYYDGRLITETEWAAIVADSRKRHPSPFVELETEGKP